jgi:Mg-chelatase subunit ChlD
MELKKVKKKKNNRRGLSSTITTLIIIGLSLGVVGFVSMLVTSLIKQNSELVGVQNRFFEQNMEISRVRISYPNVTFPYVNFSLTRPVGEIKSTEINITHGEGSSPSVDIVSVVDLSGSMSDKLTPLKDATKNLMDTILNGSSRLGLVGYRDVIVSSACINPSADRSALTSIINSWSASGNTCICCGINNASDRLVAQSTPEKPKAIIVMSDGEANVQCSKQGTGDSKLDAIKAACDANSTLGNTKIWAVGVGGADAATLSAIAQCGGGSYFSVNNASDLIQIYQTIAAEIKSTYAGGNGINYISILFYNSTTSYKDKIVELPGLLQTKTYSFDLQGKLAGKIIKIELYPVIIGQSNKEYVGPLISSWISD